MNIFKPKEIYRRVNDISLDYLTNDVNIKGLIFDFDGTITFNRRLPIETIEFIREAKKQNLKVSVLSNNVFVSNKILKLLKIRTVKKFALKPLKKPFLEMARTMELDPKNIAVIGNNRISDILGANRAGMYSIYIQNMNNFIYRKQIKRKLKKFGIKKIK